MSKYEPLTRYLANRRDESWVARFSEVERILGFDLPRSAYEYPAWWANQERGHSQTRGWRDAGWETCNVDLRSKRLMFAKAKKKSGLVSSKLQRPTELLQRAKELTGITTEAELIEAALNALIQRETANYVASLGGTMPDAEAAPRRRITW
jgi:Bacterial antitoxin of type II TA system, VapB